MMGPNISGFQRPLTRFKEFVNRKSPELIDQFMISGPQDVRRICIEIQELQGRDGSLRRMKRIEGFIEAMDQLGKSIEVFVNVNEFVCFVWGPIKFLLGVAKQYIDSFDKLLDVYAKVGDAMPGLTVYQSTFEKHPPLATVLEDYYSDILRFHEAALIVFMRPGWQTAFRSVWKTFDTQFKPILESLNRRRELLESEKGSATLHEISKARDEIASLNEEIKRKGDIETLEKHKWQLSQVQEKLEAPDYQLDQEMATEDRTGGSSGTWVLQNPGFKKWIDRSTREHEILYVSGIPGAGKTTLASFIVASLLEDICTEGSGCDTLVVYFYFKHNQSDKRAQKHLLRAMLEQMITRDPSLSDHLFNELASITGVNLRSTQKLESLVTASFEHFRTCFIVIDGLDEAFPVDAIKTLKWLLPLTEGPVQENGPSIRLLFSGQRDGLLDHELSSQASIALETIADHDMDIRNYCAQVCAQIRSKFRISTEMETNIISQVTSQANGMFLYARVVLENLLNQTRLSRLRQEMQPDVFPDGIERAYERVAVRILQTSPPAQREDAAKILGWLTCAERLLYWREIQAIFCIDPENDQVDYVDEHRRVSCKQLCGSLVDVHHAKNGQDGPDDIVKIVHETAREYMIRNGWIDLGLEHAKAATFCFRYLTSMPFLHDNDDDQILRYAKQGYYALQDYSVQYCLDHFLKATEPRASDAIGTVVFDATTAAADFLESYAVSEELQGLENQLSHEWTTQFIKKLPKKPRDRLQLFDITHRTARIRGQIEKLRNQTLTTEDLQLIDNLYGLQSILKCPKPWCNYFTTGFSTSRDRNKHIECHERPFRCPEEDCFASQLGFDTERKLNQHTINYHPISNTGVKFPKRVVGARPLDLIQTISEGNLDKLMAFLDSGEDPNETKQLNLLLIAVKHRQFEICKQLLARGSKIFPSKVDREYAPAMSLAIEDGLLDIVYLLLCQPELSTPQGRRMLPDWIIHCFHSRKPEMFKLLFGSPAFRGVDIGDIDKLKGKNILDKYSNKRHLDSLRWLLDYGFSEFVKPDTLFRAESRHDEDVVSLLRPIVDKTHPPYSLQRAKSFLNYFGLGTSDIGQGQLAILQSLSPDAQRKIARVVHLGRESTLCSLTGALDKVKSGRDIT